MRVKVGVYDSPVKDSVDRAKSKGLVSGYMAFLVLVSFEVEHCIYSLLSTKSTGCEIIAAPPGTSASENVERAFQQDTTPASCCWCGCLEGLEPRERHARRRLQYWKPSVSFKIPKGSPIAFCRACVHPTIGPVVQNNRNHAIRLPQAFLVDVQYRLLRLCSAIPVGPEYHKHWSVTNLVAGLLLLRSMLFTHVWGDVRRCAGSIELYSSSIAIDRHMYGKWRRVTDHCFGLNQWSRRFSLVIAEESQSGLLGALCITFRVSTCHSFFPSDNDLLLRMYCTLVYKSKT